MSGPPYDDADPHRLVRLEAMRLRRLDLDDSRIGRCWYCGEWQYAQQACSVCAAPADKNDLREVAS